MFGVIGAGNMGSAIIRGAVSSGFLQGKDVVIFDTNTDFCKALCEDIGAECAESADDVYDNCDKILFAVKPNVLGNVIESASSKLSGKLIISIAAGRDVASVKSYLGDTDARIIRVMPNINATVHESMCAYAGCDNVTDEDESFVKSLLNSFGKSVKLDESYFSIYSAIAGCGPAFVYMFIDSMARAGVKHGLTKKDSLQIAAQTVLGSAKAILENDVHPWEMVDRVCSPGGTTIEGVSALEENAFQSVVASAIEASFNKDKKI